MKSRTFSKLTLVILGILLVSAALVADRNPAKFRSTEKAFYADERTASFVRPGLVMQVTKADIAADGTIKAWIKLTDPQGLPLDRLGVQTPGLIAVSFLVAYLPGGETQYVSYITRQRVSGANTATQATGDTGGAWQQIADGEYVYTFAAKAPADFDKNATHTIGIYGSRNLTEFSLGTNRADNTFNFVPSGGAVTQVRDVVRTSTCNHCHDQLALHGGNRRSTQLCILCHTPQTTEPATGNTVDFKVMVHKIHMGSSLPSVVAKGKYLIGTTDFSTVGFPSPNMACGACHESQKVSGAAQADNWKTNPTRAACGACHDDVNFATGVNHPGGPMANDATCSQCHTANATGDFDASVPGAHVVPTQSSLLEGINLGIEKVANASPGKNPEVTFTAKNNAGAGIPLAQLTTIRLYMGGPTTDIPTYTREDVAAKSVDLGGGRYAYTFTAALPATTKGSWQFGVEGYRNVTLMKGTTKEKAVRESGLAKVMTVSVDGKPMQPRRTPVSTAKCNACHLQIGLHGGSRNNTQLCTFCHNPTLVDGTTGDSWNFPNFIHRIHADEVRYPGNITTCSQCHDNNSQYLPLQETMMPVTSKSAPLAQVPPMTNACTSCHNDMPTWRHAVANNTALGESCDVCHGPTSEFSVAKVHAQ